MEGTDRDKLPGGRAVNVTVFGDTAEEIELAALDEARAYFCSDVQLRIVPDYGAQKGSAFPGGTSEKKYGASVKVETVGYPS